MSDNDHPIDSNVDPSVRPDDTGSGVTIKGPLWDRGTGLVSQDDEPVEMVHPLAAAMRAQGKARSAPAPADAEAPAPEATVGGTPPRPAGE